MYNVLQKQFAEPQIALMKSAKGVKMGKVVVSLIQMSTHPRLLFERCDIDDDFVYDLQQLEGSDGRSHGNYIPALQAVNALLDQDVGRGVRVMVMFLSDGAPSDHVGASCDHGVKVWTGDGTCNRQGRENLGMCYPNTVRQCRADIKLDIRRQCLELIQCMGDKIGRDRVSLHTVAFGPAVEDFAVLQEMATVLPRSSFQKLGLAAGNLLTAFSSLSSTLTSLRTEGGAHGLTLRAPRQQETQSSAAASLGNRVVGSAGWHIYTGRNLVSKQMWSESDKTFINVPLLRGATGIAMMEVSFGQGAERVAFRCTEVGPENRSLSRDAIKVGLPLVAKETLFEEHLLNATFHKQMARIQAEGHRLAQIFNARLARTYPQCDGMMVRFAPCTIYEVLDPFYKQGRAWIFAEPFLEGCYTKWNNNNGAVRSTAGATLESLVPQAFSHFTWSVTDGSVLICDLQGVWNKTDGYMCTDPAMHRNETIKKHDHKKARSTDKGVTGIRNFFETHVCSALCIALGSKPYKGL